MPAQTIHQSTESKGGGGGGLKNQGCTHTVFSKRIAHGLGGFGFLSPLSTHKTSLFLLKVEPRRVSSHFRTQTISLKPQRQIMELQSSLPIPLRGKSLCEQNPQRTSSIALRKGDPSARSPLHSPPVGPARATPPSAPQSVAKRHPAPPEKRALSSVALGKPPGSARSGVASEPR